MIRLLRLTLPGLVLLAAGLDAAPVPTALAAALDAFRAEGSKGWAFTQTTTAGDKQRVERFDPVRPDFHRWTLLSQDGRPPTPAETTDYEHMLTRRTGGGTAPNVKDQIDRATCEPLGGAEPGFARYRFKLHRVDADDRSAGHMDVVFTLHLATGTISRVELASTGPFSPAFLVDIAEARTVMNYTLPGDGRPTLLDSVTMRVRGRAMWVRSLDQDMTIVYSDYTYTGRKPAAP